MNKRRKKKELKKFTLFVLWSVTSYKELKEMKKAYHECILGCRRMESVYGKWEDLI